MVSLSVVIPVKNGMPYIKEAVESVLVSKSLNLELLISDDHSTDGTWDYLQSIQDSRVRLYRQEQSLKVDQHWTFICREASGEFIKLLCADDVISEGGLERQVQALRSSPDVQLVSSSRSIIDKNSNCVIKKHGRAGLLGHQPGQKVLRHCFKSGTNILGEPSAITFRTTYFLKFLPWNAHDPYMLDFELYSRLLPSCNVIFLKSTDSSFRIHSNSISSKNRNDHFVQFIKLYKMIRENEVLTEPLNWIEELQVIMMTKLKSVARGLIFKFVWLKSN